MLLSYGAFAAYITPNGKMHNQVAWRVYR